MPTVRTTRELRCYNKKRIIQFLRKNDGMTKTSIASVLQLSFATVSTICNELIQEGIVEEGGPGESSGGRAPATILLRPESKCILCLDFTMQEQLKLGIVNLTGKPICKAGIPIESDLDLNLLVLKASELVTKLMATHDFNARDALGLGVVVPGIYDMRSDSIMNCTNATIEGVRLKDSLLKHFSVPIWIENDANLAALASLQHAKKLQSDNGRNRQARSVVFIYIGYGLGLGIVIDGEIIRGSSGFAGEIAHLPIGDPNANCKCGNHGCLEASLSIDGILADYHKRLSNYGKPAISGNSHPLDAFFRDAERGTMAASETVEHIGRLTGILASGLANILDPDTVYIGGEIDPILLKMMPYVREEAFSRLVVPSMRHVTVEPALGIEDLLFAGCGEAIFQQWRPD